MISTLRPLLDLMFIIARTHFIPKLFFLFAIFSLFCLGVVFSSFGSSGYIVRENLQIVGNGVVHGIIIAPSETDYQTVRVVNISNGLSYVRVSDNTFNGNVLVLNTTVNGIKRLYAVFNVSVNYQRINNMYKTTTKDIDRIIETTNAVYNTFKYDESYTGANRTVDEILDSKVGICTDYARATAYVLGKYGIQPLYVYGYVPDQNRYHLWLIYKQLEFDPTYGMVGLLSSNRIIFGNGKAYTINTYSINHTGKIKLLFDLDVRKISETQLKQNITCNFSFDKNKRVVVLRVKGKGFMYRYIPTLEGGAIKGAVYDNASDMFYVNFPSNSVYILNISAKYNDIVCSKNILVDLSKESERGNSNAYEDSKGTLSSMEYKVISFLTIVIFIISFLFIYTRFK